jgi:hypothetical protein
MTKEDIAELAATKAAPLFSTFGWTYGKGAPPTHQELQDTVEGLIDRCPEEGFSSTGRFTVRRQVFDDMPEISVSLDLYEGPELDAED